jgi:hypothetical protein
MPQSQGYAFNAPLGLYYGAIDVNHLLQTMRVWLRIFFNLALPARVFPVCAVLCDLRVDSRPAWAVVRARVY